MAQPVPEYRLDDPVRVLEEYQATGDAHMRNDLVMHYSYIAKSVAIQMRGITSSYAQVEDIVNEGIITIMDCLDKFSPDKGMKFENYAFMRVRNSNIDYVRRQDWVPRRVRRTAQNVSAAYNELATELMREPTNQELADHMGLPVETLASHLAEMHMGVVVAFEDLVQGAVYGYEDIPMSGSQEAAYAPDGRIMRAELRQQLVDAIEMLTEKERQVVSLYYYEHLKLHEIAKVMQVSESRISQINAKSVLKIRRRLEAYMNGVQLEK